MKFPRGRTYDEDDFESKPTAVGDKPSPINTLQSNRVDKSREKSCTATKELEDGDSSRALGKGKEFHEESYLLLAPSPVCSPCKHLLYVSAL